MTKEQWKSDSQYGLVILLKMPSLQHKIMRHARKHMNSHEEITSTSKRNNINNINDSIIVFLQLLFSDLKDNYIKQ